MNRVIGSIWNRVVSVCSRVPSVWNRIVTASSGVPSVWSRVKDQLVKVEGRKPQLQKGLWWALGIIFVLQLYFVRELLAAEMLFGLGFVALLLLGAVVYLLGTLGERGLAWSEARVRIVAQSARRGLSTVEEISRRPFRHPRSESVQ